MKRSTAHRVTRNHLGRLQTARLCLESLEARNLLDADLIPLWLAPVGNGVNDGVSPSAKISIQFDSPIDGDSLTPANFRLELLPDPAVDVPGRRSRIGQVGAPACGSEGFPFNCTITLDPFEPLLYSSTYRVIVQGGATGVISEDGLHHLGDDGIIWQFTTARNPSLGTEDYNPDPLVTDVPPILLVTSDANPYSRYLGELLRAEGLSAFATCSIETTPIFGDSCVLQAANLARFDVVLLGEVEIIPSQAAQLQTYVTGGGNLIAMRPDADLIGLLGLGTANGPLSDAYIDVFQNGPGRDIVDEMMKYHGDADQYSGVPVSTQQFAQLCATGPAMQLACSAGDVRGPAVTLNAVGDGQAAAFTYDLAKSVVLTRQGNPDALNEEGLVERRVPRIPFFSDLITPYDLFAPECPDPVACPESPDFADPTLHYNDLQKIAIPQADEQQHLLANLIHEMNADKKPLPRLWFLPSYFGEAGVPLLQEAALVMTGDDHLIADDGYPAATVDRYMLHSGDSSGGKPVRSSSYIDCHDEVPPPPGVVTCQQADQPDDAELAQYAARGFESGLHATRMSTDPTWDFIRDQLREDGLWHEHYESLPTPSSNRTHRVEWFDWDGHAVEEFANRIRLDTNYLYFFDGDQMAPEPDMIPGRYPGLFTGSGMPMRFARANGTVLDVFQAATQMTDQSQQCYYFEGEPTLASDCDDDYQFLENQPNTVEHLLNNAAVKGYYGVFTVLSHTDRSVPCVVPPPGMGDTHDSYCMSEKILERARHYRVPVFSGREMLEWLDGRSGSSFRQVQWTAPTLTFHLEAAVGLPRLGSDLPTMQAMLPSCSGVNGNRLRQVIRNGAGDVLHGDPQEIKGVEYRFFWAREGDYVAHYDGASCSPGAGPQSGAGSAMSGFEVASGMPWFALAELDEPGQAAASPATSPDSPTSDDPVAVPADQTVSVTEPLPQEPATSAGAAEAARSSPPEPPTAVLDVLFADFEGSPTLT